jgi:ADP-heptose:LPS heptosyltransferase
MRSLRAPGYDCAIDFQALYKSAFIAAASGAPKRIGFQSSYAREGLAALFYTTRVNPQGAHKVDHNLTLTEAAGACKSVPRFPVVVRAEDEAICREQLERHGIGADAGFYVLNPGGGWRSKCWPPERYAELQALLARHTGWRGVVSYGPGEEALAGQVVKAAASSLFVALPLGLGPLAALLRRAKFVVSADTGPLHLGAAIGARVIGLFGPTDPARNGPYGTGIVIRNPRNCETSYKRGKDYASSMSSITADQVLAAARPYLSAAA